MISIGMDVSKGYADVGIINNLGIKLCDVFLIDDNNSGYNLLDKKIQLIKETNTDEIIRVGMEHTGGYETNFYNYLVGVMGKYNIEVYRLNPLSVKRFIESDLHRGKTDRMNAIDIANYMLNRKLKKNPVVSFEIEGLKSCIKMIEKNVLEASKIRNELNSKIYKYFPDLLKYCDNGLNYWVIILLSKYPTISDLKNIKLEDLLEIKYLKREIAEKLIELSKETIIDKVDSLSKIVIQQLCSKLLMLDEFTKDLTRTMHDKNIQIY